MTKNIQSPKANAFNYSALEDAWNKHSIAVLDSMPGSGKTTAITDYIKTHNLNHVIFVTPFLSECEVELPNVKLKGMHFKFPAGGQGGKIQQLKELIEMGDTSSGNRFHRITCTHSAFKGLPHSVLDQLKHYTIIIDEQLDIIQKLDDIGPYTEDLLLGHGSIESATKLYTLNDPDWFTTTRSDEIVNISVTGYKPNDPNYELYNLAYLKRLYQYSQGNWFDVLNPDLLTKANRVLVLTHGFDCSFMHCWLKMHSIDHSYVDNEKLGLRSESSLKAALKSNLRFIEATAKVTQLNESKNGRPLSIAHWKSLSEEELKELGKTLDHIVKDKMKCKSDEIFWTAPKIVSTKIKSNSPRLSGKITLDKPFEIEDGSTEDELSDDSSAGQALSRSPAKNKGKSDKALKHDSWLPCNIKARNDFGSLTNCLYAMTLNPHPAILNILSDKSGFSKGEIENTFQLNNLLQFIYRGSIRNNQSMNLCIVPEKTKKLLQRFLD